MLNNLVRDSPFSAKLPDAVEEKRRREFGKNGFLQVCETGLHRSSRCVVHQDITVQRRFLSAFNLQREYRHPHNYSSAQQII